MSVFLWFCVLVLSLYLEKEREEKNEKKKTHTHLVALQWEWQVFDSMCVFQCLISSPGGLHLFVNYVLVGGGAFQVQTAVLWPDAEAVCSHPDRFRTWTWLSTRRNTFFLNKKLCVICHWICQIISFFFFSFFWGWGVNSMLKMMMCNTVFKVTEGVCFCFALFIWD